MDETRLQALTEPLLRWYGENARVLPWREKPPQAYHVWVSEIMLQQTRVAAVMEYYTRFLQHFPTIEALAAAPEEELLKCWEGLGYYSRARNLQKAARVTVERFGGVLPDTYETLLTLPGIGDYTAGAIASIAYGRRCPAVDGNVLRVAARIMDCHEDIMDPRSRRRFRGWVEAALPEAERCGDYNQAMMDIGATVCLPNGAPLCDQCPGREVCAARASGWERQLPVKAPKRPRRVEERTVFVLLRGRETALRRREEPGLLSGLWEFPNVEGTIGEKEAADRLKNWGIEVTDWVQRLTAKHIFTHVEWHMTGYVLRCRGEGPFTWTVPEEMGAIPSAFARFRQAMAEAVEKEDVHGSL